MRRALPILAWGLGTLALVLLVLLVQQGENARHVVWSRPEWALAAVLPIAAVLVRAAWSPRPATMRFSRTRSLHRVGGGLAARLVWLPDGLRLAAALLLVAALARPQSTRGADRIRHEGIDIVVVLDLSESMKSGDM